MLAKAKNKNLINVNFKKADAASLPFSDNSFDLVTSITMLEFTNDVTKIFKEIYRVLKPNGWIIFGSLNRNSELGKQKNADEIFKHAHFFSKDELINSFSLFGKPSVNQCVYLSSTFEILDNTPLRHKAEGAFLVTCVQKTK